MPEILTESFCERCGTRYTFEAVAKPSTVTKLKVLSKGLKNYVLSDETSLDEALADARSEELRQVSGQQLDAFHKTFNFCMSCRQYTCANCWNQLEGRCLSCAPHLGHDVLPAPFPNLETAFDVELGSINGNGAPHQPLTIDAQAWPTVDLHRTGLGGEHLPETPTVADLLAAPPEAEPQSEDDVTAEAGAAGAISPADEAPAVDAPHPTAEEKPAASTAMVDRLRAGRSFDDLAAQAAARTESLLAQLRPGEEELTFEERAHLADIDADLTEVSVEQPVVSAEPAVAAEASIEPVPEPALAAEAALEPEPEPALVVEAEVTPAPVAPEPEPIEAAPQAAEHAAEPEPVAELVAPEPEPETEPVEPQPTGQPAYLESEPIAAFTAEPPAPSPAPGPSWQPTAPWQIVAPEATPPASPSELPIAASAAPVGPAPRAPAFTSSATPTWPAPPSSVTAPASPPAQSDSPSWPTPPWAPPDPSRLPLAAIAPKTQFAQRSTEALWAASSGEVLGRPGTSAVQACVSCGLPLSATARFCRRCGSRQG